MNSYSNLEISLEDQLNIWEKVNECKTLKELSDIILELSDNTGAIKGKSCSHNAEVMSQECLNFSPINYNSLTRKHGIRAQAMLIYYYDQKNN